MLIEDLASETRQSSSAITLLYQCRYIETASLAVPSGMTNQCDCHSLDSREPRLAVLVELAQKTSIESPLAGALRLLGFLILSYYRQCLGRVVAIEFLKY